MMIVSANYRDRRSSNPWLIREESQHPSEAVECKAVIATDVAFCPSSSFEEGFGCSTVAFCDTAEGFDSDVGSDVGNPLHFYGHSFFSSKKYTSRDRVPTCGFLILHADRSMQFGRRAEDAREIQRPVMTAPVGENPSAAAEA